MKRSKDFEVRRLYRLLGELVPYSMIENFNFSGWIYEGKNIDLPFAWNYNGINHVVFSNKFSILRKNDFEDVYIQAWFGGESLVLIDEEPYGEINAYHKELNITPFCDGEEHKIEVQTVARGLFGTREESVFKYSRIVVYDNEIRKVIFFVKNVIDTIKETNNESLANALVNLADEFLSKLNIPHATENYIKTVKSDPAIVEQVSSVWSPAEFPYFESVYDKKVKENILNGFEIFREKLKSLRNLFPKFGKAYVAGHAHIDYAWLWPVHETKRKIVRTFANAVQLAKKYKNFVYIQSSAQMYEDLKSLYPELFEQIRNLVKNGQWEPVGGMWVESDCNVPGVESLIRQFYYGQKFFEKEFGKISKVAWLPDVFGFSWFLPQILKQTGIDYFVTTKLNWNEANDFPYDICKWRGIDGSEVIYYNFKNFEEGYNGRISAKSLINTFSNFRQKELTDKFFISFGYGDGGGGPSEEMCESYNPLNEIPGVPEVEYSTTERFFSDLMQDLANAKLPIWDGELYLELHRGTLTSQSRTKILHKIAEDELRTTEILNALFLGDKQAQIDELWKVLLRNEFHDILPGSSIKEVYEDTEKELNYVIEQCDVIQKSFFDGNDEIITIFNPSSFKQRISFEYNNFIKTNDCDKSLKTIKTYRGNYLCVSENELKPFEILSFKVQREKSEFHNTQKFVDDYTIENGLLLVHIYRDGSINIFNKVLKKWAFNEKGNVLVTAKDIPAYWENWDIDYRTRNHYIVLKAEKIKIVEDNEIRKVVEIFYDYEGSRIWQYLILENESDELKVETKIDWHHRRSILKVLFPTNVLSRYAKYDIDGGYIQRPTHDNTNFEQARFEVLGHRWIDVSQYDHGVCIINNGKYGHIVKGSTIEMTLVKAGIYPDFFADEGEQSFIYSIYLHGFEDVKEFYARADKLNKKIKAFNGKPLTKGWNLNISSDSLRVLSLRKVDEKIYLRILETVGSSGTATIKLEGINFKEVKFVDILENKISEVEFKEGKIELTYKPFKIYTIEFVL
ncbi:alpha-mannosidase [Fervidobacterium sp. SC_NGM5_G05]|nr:alpha-mannosidase [Fervidobacterium sp. SC_NGM5_G05]